MSFLVSFSTSDVIATSLPDRKPASYDNATQRILEEAMLATKREFVENVLELTGGNRKQAAVILGIHPKSMSRLLERLDM